MAFSRTLRDLRENRRSTVIALVLVVVLVLGVGVWWWREHRSGLHLRGEFTAAVGIYPGNDVRILGVKVGEVTSVTPEGRIVMVSMTLDHGIDVRADTKAEIITPNLVSDRYVELTGAYAGGPKLADDTTLGLSRTRTPVELDSLYQSLISLFTSLGPKGANK
ncbi:MlaD family protein, partial [Jatrophihabitans endophyticus]|uniref:MlaD family protein n=1 Tax=Jatrophihabitans endophyticus TaxID=1206085 RepID=UPI0019DE375A